MKNRKNLAFISLILGIVGCLTGVVLVGAVFGIAAIVLGIISSGNSKSAKDRRRSQIGIITGAVAIAYTTVLYAWVGLHPAVTQKEPLLPQTTMSSGQQAGGTESTAPVITVTPTPSPRPTAKVEPTTRPETDGSTDSDTDRKTDAETDGSADSDTDRKTDAGADGDTDRKIDAGADGDTDRRTDAGTDGSADRKTERGADAETDGSTDRGTCKDTGR